MTTVAAFLLALFQAIPALERLSRSAITELDRKREAEAAQRLKEKDARVDAAIGPPKS